MNRRMSDQTVGQILSNHRVERFLGSSAIGSVYQAVDVKTRRMAALTLFLLPDALPPAVCEQFGKRAGKQGDLLVKLQHPYLLPYYGYGEWEGFPYLITPYTSQGSLATQLTRQELYSPERMLSVLEQVTTGLEYAHRQGQIHGMLAAANLLFTENGSFQIAGLGLRKILERRGLLICTKSSEYVSTVAGTPLCELKYLSPEYRQGQEATIRSDIYSLGVLLVEAISGKLLPNDISAQEIVSQHEGSLPTFLQPIVRKALAQNPYERFQRMSDFFAVYAELMNQVRTEERRPVQIEERRLVGERRPAEPFLAPIRIVQEENVAPILIAHDFQTDQPFEERWAMPAQPPVRAASARRARAARRGIQQTSGLPRRQMTALLASGVALAVVGVGGLNLLQNITTPGTMQKAGATPTNVIGSTTLALNSSVQFLDPKAANFRQRLLIHLPNGNFVAYKQGCTHSGVLVDYKPDTHLLHCPAHGAVFDPAKNGKVLGGPTNIPLPMVGIQVQGNGAITLL